jgi:hypothetical protein
MLKKVLIRRQKFLEFSLFMLIKILSVLEFFLTYENQKIRINLTILNFCEDKFQIILHIVQLNGLKFIC